MMRMIDAGEISVSSVRIRPDADPSEWDAGIAGLGGGLFHCHDYTVYAARLSRSQPLFLEAFGENGDCLGMGAGMVSVSKYWPFSRYCREAVLPALPAARGDRDTAREVLASFERELKKQGVYSMTVHSYDSPGSEEVLSALGYATEARSEFILDLRRTADDIWNDFHQTRRRNLRQAEKLELLTREMNDREGLELVFGFQTESMERRGIEVREADHSMAVSGEHLLDTGKAIVLAVFRGDEPLCAGMFGRFDHSAYYLLGGSSVEGNNSRAPVQMMWTAIKRFKEEGRESFNLGGAREEEEGLYRFKKYFGGEVVSMPRGTKVLSSFGAKLCALRHQSIPRPR